ncbi:MAG: hypothetical protein ABIN96_00285 [Rubrivivax sp.]
MKSPIVARRAALDAGPLVTRVATHVAAFCSAAALLGGCGAEVAGTAATVGTLQAQQARQAQAQQKQIVEGMDQAMKAAGEATASAAAAQ